MKRITFSITFLFCLVLTIGVFGQASETVNGTVATTQPFMNFGRVVPNTGTYYTPSSLAPGLIYDNGPIINVPPDRSRLESVTLGMNILGFGAQTVNNNRMADDVTLTDDYDITELRFYCYQTGSTTTSTITGITLRIWDGVPGVAGSNIIWGDATTNVLASTTWSNVYRDTETSTTATNRPIMEVTVAPVGLTLTAGTYWLDWNYSGSLGSGPWAPPIAILGQANTGNALQSIAGGPYNPALDTPPGTNEPQGMPFQIYGSALGGGPVAECGTGNPQLIPASGSGGPGCASPTLSPATVAATGTIGTGSGEYILDFIEIDLEHTWASDLDIYLVSPGGAVTVELSTDNGGSTGLDTRSILVFDDDSVNAITGWTGGTPAGDYLAEGGLLNTLLAGQPINGDWTLRICDDSGGDTGTLYNYCINFTEATVVVGNPPTIVCPADIVINNTAGTCGGVANFAGVAFDVEDGDISSSIVATPPSGSTFPVGDTTVELSVTDSDGNTVTCSFMVTVVDNEAPVAVCQDLTVDLDPVTGMATITGADVDNGSTDNCGIASLSLDISSFDCSMTGANTVTLTVTDNAGNSSTCTSTVTVQDVTAPEVFCVGGFGVFTESEDFEGSSIPSGWTTVIESGSQDWTFGSGDMPTGGDFPTNAAIFDDDAAGSGPANMARLLSPVYDLTSASNVQLSFDYALQDFAGSGVLYADVWDGSAWQQVFIIDDVDVDPVNTGDIDVSAYANAAFQVRFTYDDEDGGWNWGAGVDNFLLSYEAASGGGLDVYLDANGMASVDPNDLVSGVNEACGYTITAGGTGGGTMETLTTTFAGGNGLDGAMFDVVAVNDLTIDSFDVNLDTGITDDIEVYFKTGTWVGFHTDPSAWTLLATTNVTSVGDGMPTPLNLNLGVVVAPGERVAFYVTTINGGMNYTNGTTTGNLFASDANLEFYEGRGMSYPFTGGFEPRVFNGNIHYTTGGGSGLDFTCAELGENIIEVTVTDDSGNSATCMAVVNVIDNISPVITCGPANTTTTETEDFEGASIPAGWSTDIAAGSQDWTFGSGVMPGGPAFATNAAIFDDDAAGSGQVNNATL
ncbi:HYR domain-containing protein, partial [Aequorivita todarodis]|uniref:HYR domain-containing protein n=1 Tax=Aequorivita todarodis TaxID=2036821 RepID=UPI00234FD735